MIPEVNAFTYSDASLNASLYIFYLNTQMPWQKFIIK